MVFSSLSINDLPQSLSICTIFLFNSLPCEIVPTSCDPIATHVEIGFKGASHFIISTREQRETGKIQRNNYHDGNSGPSLTGKTSSVSLIFKHRMSKLVE